MAAQAVLSSSFDVFMARQPIFDRSMRVAGYELLYRSGASGGAGPMDAEANARALANVLVEIGLENLVGKHPAYVNVPGSLLGSEAITLLPRDRVVLELLEELEMTPECEQAIRRLQAKGYTLALDDYVFAEYQKPFLKHVSTVKVDVLASKPAEVAGQVRQLKAAGLQLLAEKVEDRETFQRCLKLGFDLFQGYFFAKPVVMSGRGMAADRTSLVHLIAKLNDPTSTIAEIEALVASDLAISYRVLRLINSAAIGLGREVGSIREAILLIGLNRVAALASLIALASVPSKPSELITVAMVRGAMCEKLAGSLGFANAQRHFTVGLLSVLEAFLDTPVEALVQQLPLAPEIKAALTGADRALPESCTLQAVLSYEKGVWDAAMASGASADALAGAYQNSLQWASEIGGAIAA